MKPWSGPESEREGPLGLAGLGVRVVGLSSDEPHGASRAVDDPFGPCLLARWWDEGVDTVHCRLVEGQNGVYFVGVDEGGERKFTRLQRGQRRVSAEWRPA